MTTDQTPDGVAGARAGAMEHLVKRAVRPIDIEHDQLMARAEAEHQVRIAAGQARAANDRRAVLLWAADEIDRRDAEQGFPEDGVGWATAELRRMAAGERDEQQTQQDGAETLAAALDGLHTLIATSSRDWGTYRVDAWLWAVLVGWDCEEAHGHDELCEDGAAMRELADRHGWDEATVAKARRYRAAVRMLTGPAAAPVAGQPPADTREETREETVHARPGPDDNGISPCCGRPPFEFRGERLTRDPALVTCPTPPAVVAEPGKENDGPHAVCMCSHIRAAHVTVSGRLLCDECDPDSTENLVCKEFEAL